MIEGRLVLTSFQASGATSVVRGALSGDSLDARYLYVNSVISSDTSTAAAARLRLHFKGRVLVASDAAYPVARAVWNGAVHHPPAVIAQCADENDVAIAIRTARRL